MVFGNVWLIESVDVEISIWLSFECQGVIVTMVYYLGFSCVSHNESDYQHFGRA